MDPSPSRLLLLTDARRSPRRLCDQVRAAAAGGRFDLMLREKHLPSLRRRELADQLSEVTAAFGSRLLVADPDWPAPACHLSAPAPAPTPRPAVVGRSAHLGDDPPEGVDYVTYSPVYASRSKPGYGPALGLAELSRFCAAVGGMPVYALGGVDGDDKVLGCRAAGAFGVAVMGAVMTASDPAAVVAGFNAALG